MLEIEKTYLLKYLPKDLKRFPHYEILDIYFPGKAHHPRLRLRRRGDKYEMTKKFRVPGKDASTNIEQTIDLTKLEFEELAQLPGRRIHKVRYRYQVGKRLAEVDLFLDGLKGLAVVDFEFISEIARDQLRMPDFCLSDITTADIMAGGRLCGKKYSDLAGFLQKRHYKKLKY